MHFLDNLRLTVLSNFFPIFVAQDRDLVTPEMKTTEVFGHHGVDGVLVASHVTKGDNLGIEPVFLLLNALIVKHMKSKLVILTNA